MLKASVLVVLAVFLAGCSENVETPSGAKEEPMRLLAQGGHSGLHDEERLEIRTLPPWSALWERHGSDQTPPPDRPEVDFATERVVVLAMGDRPNSCYGVEIDRIVTDEATAITTVEATERGPDAESVCAEVVTQPHVFVAIPLKETRVAFRVDAFEP